MNTETETLLVRAEGEIGPGAAAEWHEPLRAALNSGRGAVIDLTAATELSLPAYQVLLSARQTFHMRGIPFNVQDPAGIAAALAARIGTSQEGEA